MNPQGHIPESAPRGAHEGADLDHRLVLRFGLALAFLILFSIGSIFILYRHFEQKYFSRTSEAAPVVAAADLPPLPRLQTAPARDLESVVAAENLHLNRYAWVDRPQGVAQIPIDRAMDLWVRSYVAPSAIVGEPTNAAPSGSAPPVSELQMRQQKAQESTHVP